MTSTILADRHRQPELVVGDLTETTREAIAYAYRYAGRLRAGRVHPEHLLLGVLSAPAEAISQALIALKVDRNQISQSLQARLSPQEIAAESLPRMSSETSSVIWDAAREARLLGHAQIDSIHLLLGLLYESDSAAYAALEAAGLSLFDLRQYILKQPKQMKIRDQGEEYINTRALRSQHWQAITSAAKSLGLAMFALLICWPFFIYWERWTIALNWHFWPVLAFLAFLISYIWPTFSE
jgi:ATP-dependent Clp protease ATP-binding subunit ClpA